MDDDLFVSIYNDFKAASNGCTNVPQLNDILQKCTRRVTKGTACKTPTKSDMLKAYQRLVYDMIKPDPILSLLLTTKLVRSSSGVLPISVALDGNVFSCSYDCSYCPNECKANGAKKDMARSYLSSEGTFIRGAVQDFNIVEQIWRRLAELESMGHTPDKCEIIPLGGTFDCFPAEYRKYFSLSVFYACNMYSHISIRFEGARCDLMHKWLKDRPFMKGMPLSREICEALKSIRPIPYHTDENLIYEQDLNTKGKHCRVIGIVVETRPDRINRATMTEMRLEGVTRVQLGIQHTDEEVLVRNTRGHKVIASIKANKFLRDAGFKVDGHLMPDLPGTTLALDYNMMRDVFQGEQLQLDYTKIYPCLDLPYTKIREWKESGEWEPIAETNFPEFMKLLCYTMSIIPPWTRVNRVHRDFPEASVKNQYNGYVSDTIRGNLQQLVHLEMERQGLRCYDIRSREIGNENIDEMEACLYIRAYRANQGTEFFISVEVPQGRDFDDAKLLGLCRLRIPDYELEKAGTERYPLHYLPCFRRKQNCIARIREVHTYGKIVSDGDMAGCQHRGVGKFLIRVAENISSMCGCDMVTVISGVGVRDYYEHLDYVLDQNVDQYMVKYLPMPSQLAPMQLFGKTYHYKQLQQAIYSLKISKEYLSIGLHQTHKWRDIHTYKDIQHGEAQGIKIYAYEEKSPVHIAAYVLCIYCLLVTAYILTFF